MNKSSNLHDLPLYKQIELKILDDIRDGVYTEGSRIPTQKWFVDTYGVSRVTIRKAMDELVRKDVLITRKGGGTYVREHGRKADISNNGFISNTNRIGGFTTNLNRDGQSAKSIILDMEVIESDKRISDALYVSLGTKVVKLKRLRLVNDVAMSVEHSFIHADLVPQLDFFTDFKDNMSLYSFLVADGGLELSHANEDISAINPPLDISQLLAMERRVPLLFIKRRLYTKSQDIIEYCEIHCRTDIYSFCVDYPA